MWAEIVDADRGLYKIANVPFYAKIASNDVVFAEYDNTERMLTCRETAEYSGNSIVQVVILDKSVLTSDIRDIFESPDCKSEKFKEGYFVVEVLANKQYRPIKQKLSELQDKGIIDYAAPVLSDEHR